MIDWNPNFENLPITWIVAASFALAVRRNYFDLHWNIKYMLTAYWPSTLILHCCLGVLPWVFRCVHLKCNWRRENKSRIEYVTHLSSKKTNYFMNMAIRSIFDCLIKYWQNLLEIPCYDEHTIFLICTHFAFLSICYKNLAIKVSTTGKFPAIHFLLLNTIFIFRYESG